MRTYSEEQQYDVGKKKRKKENKEKKEKKKKKEWYRRLNKHLIPLPTQARRYKKKQGKERTMSMVYK